MSPRGVSRCGEDNAAPGADFSEHSVCRCRRVTVRSTPASDLLLQPEVPLMRIAHPAARSSPSSVLAAGRPPSSSGARRRRRRADAVRPVLREEQHPLRHVRVAHLHHRPLRDLLLPGARTASRAGRRLRGKRLSADQRRPEARPAVQGSADSVQDAQRVRAGERRPGGRTGRRRRVRRAGPPADGDADRRSARIGSTA